MTLIFSLTRNFKVHISSHSSQPHTLTTEPPPPNLPGTVIVRDTIPELVEEMGHDLLTHALNCVRTFGDFHIALSAGKTPIPFYLHLMIDPVCRAIPWRKSHLWVVSEQLNNQPPGNPPNWNCIAGYFAEHAGIPNRQQHPITNQSATPHHHYESELRQTLEWREKGHDRLDYVLLGLDTDGTIAGLTPHSPLLAEHRSLVATTNQHNKPNETDNNNQQSIPESNQQITMTLPLINASRFIAIMVTGKHKQPIIQQLSHPSQPTTQNHHPKNYRTRPVEYINPNAGTLRWYLDRDACPTDS